MRGYWGISLLGKDENLVPVAGHRDSPLDPAIAVKYLPPPPAALKSPAPAAKSGVATKQAATCSLSLGRGAACDVSYLSNRLGNLILP